MKLIIPCLFPCFNVKIVLRTEPERQERERKGDLDRFERVDGDRNLTSVNLAVKKVISLLVLQCFPEALAPNLTQILDRMICLGLSLLKKISERPSKIRRL
jgi:hypothetical protein